MKIVALSDTHCKYRRLKIPSCDLLLSVGDYSFHGELDVVRDFHSWLNEQEAGHIISVQGNHETGVQKNFEQSKAAAVEVCPAVHFIEEGLVEIEGVKIWCSAWSPFFHNWAYNARRGPEIAEHWAKIPEDVDILATHGPAFEILDEVERHPWAVIEHVGCRDLLNRINVVKPDLHFCGHIHGAHGYKRVNGVDHYNVAICDEEYVPNNPITVVDYEAQ
jgi:Icc-related predicted phosphoesterase